MKVTIYKSQEKCISYDEDGWYVNNTIQQSKGGETIDCYAESAYKEAFIESQKDITNFTAHFKHVAVLTAAGTSMENGDNGGKTRKDLWQEYLPEINGIKDILVQKGGYMAQHCKEIVDSQNIENFLSFTILYEKLNGPIKNEEGVYLRKELEKKIANACRLILDDNNHHHQNFLRKLTARKPSDPRVQLYTTNYDTLFEQAATRLNYTIIDGFSFSYPRVFNGSNFDRDIVFREKTRIHQEESFIPGVFQLFKLHGSVDWHKDDNGIITQRESVDSPCIIYPASEKYESSYEQPYFEMMAHLQQTLRKEGTFLIVAGFGFQDKHIQNVIHEAVIQNYNFHLFIVCYGASPYKNAEGEEVWADLGITRHLIPDYMDEEGKLIGNVTVLYSKFKKFTEIYPLNPSYANNSKNDQYEAF